MTVPSFLAFAFLGLLIYPDSPTDFNIWFLAIWIAAGFAPIYTIQGQRESPDWENILVLTSLSLSITVNALVTGLIVFRIFKVFQEVKSSTADDQILGVTGGRTLRRIIFVLIESGMALFSVQLARVLITVVYLLTGTNLTSYAFSILVGIHKMLTVIIRSVSLLHYFTDNMGLSRVLRLPLSWYECQWGCLSTIRSPWWKLVFNLGLCTLQTKFRKYQTMELSRKRGDTRISKIN